MLLWAEASSQTLSVPSPRTASWSEALVVAGGLQYATIAVALLTMSSIIE